MSNSYAGKWIMILPLALFFLITCDVPEDSWNAGTEKCVYSECDNICVESGRQAGVCRNNGCKCIGGTAVCDPMACDVLCYGQDYAGGVCRQDECVCMGSENEDTGCDSTLCDEACLEKGALGGACREQGCVCIRGSSDTSGCDPEACDEMCLDTDRLGGVCRNDDCVCIEGGDSDGLSCGQVLLCFVGEIMQSNWAQALQCRGKASTEAKEAVNAMFSCLLTSGCTDPETMMQCLMEECGDDFNACLADYEK